MTQASPPKPLERAAASVRRHAAAIARELVKLERRHLPKGNALDPIAHEKRSAQNVLALADLLAGGSTTPLLTVLHDQMRLRQMNGFGSAEFLHTSYFYLTVLRRFVVTDGRTLGEGLAAWDAVEELLLPKLGEFIHLCLDLEDPTIPSSKPKGLSDLID